MKNRFGPFWTVSALHSSSGIIAPTSSRNFTLEGPLDDEQKARLLEIADRCPVHRTLHSEIVVETRLT